MAGSYLLYELGIVHARRSARGAAEGSFASLTMFPTQQRPSPSRTWFLATDSAEVDYFGVNRSGYRFGPTGELMRSDWTGTTMKFRVVRVSSPDVESLARRWGELDARGAGLSALSPRDTLRAEVGTARITVDYSRPSKRGRTIWGMVVPWDEVWRLGANAATHLETSRDLIIGGARVPAGRYTLWMLPVETGSSQLIVNRRVNIFGTQYDGTGDLARIPLDMNISRNTTEQLMIEIRGERLLIRWGDREWWVRIAESAPEGVNGTR
jgi:hypothetical protein